jgi:topoisomerase-4 subunit A
VAARRHRAAAGSSAQKVLEEIEELTNPKVKAGKKTLTNEQNQLKAAVLAVLDAVRDESSKDAPVRLVFEPKSRTVEQQELITTLLAHTSLESSVAAEPDDGRHRRPADAEEPAPDAGRVDRLPPATVQRRSQHRLHKVLERIHILEGRQLVLLNIDEVIRIIRHSDEPKPR